MKEVNFDCVSDKNYAPTHIQNPINRVRHRNDRGKPLFLFNDHSTFFLRQRRPPFAQREAMPNLFPNQ